MNLKIDPIILETACGHDGSEKNLLRLIDIAYFSQGKNIKFQIFNLEERALINTKEYKIFKNLVLSENTWKKSIQYAKKKKLSVFSDVYGEYSLNLALKNNVDGIKIHSEDFFNSFFIEKCLRTRRPVLIGVGGTYRSEIFDLVKFFFNKKLTQNIILMPGVQNFPTPINAHSISELKDLIIKYKKYNIKVGYADHISGNDKFASIFPLMAYSAGAYVIEKHFTDDRKLKRTDYHSALNKDEVKNFIVNFKKLNLTMQPIQKFNKFETKYRNMFKKSAALVKAAKINKKIKKNDIFFIKDTKTPSSISSHRLINKKILTKLDHSKTIKFTNINQTVGAIIVARTSSNRLKNKAIKKINNIESISQVIERVKKIKGVNKVILATSTDKSDDILERIALKRKIECFRGSLNNVASRFYMAAKKYKLDQIVRVTGDAILCDEVMLEKAIINQLKKGTDVTFIKNMPYGTAREVFTFNTIETITQNAEVSKNTEYLEWFLENSRNFKVGYIKSNYKFNKTIRLTLDFKEDLILFNNIFKYFKNDVGNFTLKDVLVYLKKNPKLIKINNYHKPKFSRKDLNINLKI